MGDRHGTTKTPKAVLELTADEREALERWARRPKSLHPDQGDSGREFTIIAGIAPTGANTATFTGDGVETTTAFVTGGRFAAWWPTASIPTSGMVQAFDEHGDVLLSVASLAPDGSASTFEAG